MSVRKFESNVADYLARSLSQKMEAELERLRKRIEQIEAAKRGEIEIKRVRVKAYKVPAYNVSAHWRMVAPRSKK